MTSPGGGPVVGPTVKGGAGRGRRSTGASGPCRTVIGRPEAGRAIGADWHTPRRCAMLTPWMPHSY